MIASTLIWSQNVDLITNVRVTAWRVLSAFVLYLVILRPLVARVAARGRRSRHASGPSPAWRSAPAGGTSGQRCGARIRRGGRGGSLWTQRP